MMKKIISFIIFTIIIVISIIYINNNEIEEANITINSSSNEIVKNETQIVILNEKIEDVIIDDWRLILVNDNNLLPEDFEIELANVDSQRQVDARIINELNQMISDMKSSGIKDIWVQSAYRDVEYQEKLYNQKIEMYLENGYSEEDAIFWTERAINKPRTSEHHLGLAVDLNNVKHDFDTTDAFKWLMENAENYGFILRYRDDKEHITNVEYEPWHWRYVGTEHAKKINELDMCLEEYIKYLKSEL